MSGKSFAVIGLGQFGMTLAKELANADYDVLAIDDKDENIQEIADTVTYAVRADVREPGILKSLGVQNVDVAIIAVAENMEASITATMQVKDLGVPLVLAKAMNSLHGRILEKIRSVPWASALPVILQPADLRMCLSFLRSSVWQNSGFRMNGWGKVFQRSGSVNSII